MPHLTYDNDSMIYSLILPLALSVLAALPTLMLLNSISLWFS